MDVTIYDNFFKRGDAYVFEIDFSDSDYILVYEDKDIVKVQSVMTEINKRIDDYFSKKSNILKTSDLGFKYILRDTIMK